MSLDFCLKKVQPTEVFSANITHNLTTMATEAGIYEALWHPDRIKAKKAKQIIKVLQSGLSKLEADPEYFKQFDSPNGWGMYEHFVPFVRKVLAACKEHPTATIYTST